MLPVAWPAALLAASTTTNAAHADSIATDAAMPGAVLQIERL